MSRSDGPRAVELRDLPGGELFALLDEGTEGTWVWAPDPDRVWWSPRLRDFLQYQEQQEHYGDTLAITHPEDRHRLDDTVQAVLDRGGRYRVEVRFRRGDGIYVWCSVRGLFLPGNSGRPSLLAGFVLDLSDQSAAREDFERSEARFRAFMDNCPAAVFLKDRRGAHVYVNRAAAAIAQTTVDAMTGSTTRDVFPPEVADKLMAADQAALEAGGPLQSSVEVPTTEGGSLHVIDVKFPVPGPRQEGELIGGFGLDVTELVRSERRLRDLDRLLAERERLDSIGLLAGGIAHDFNNLLTAIRGNIDLARRRSGTVGRNEALATALERCDSAGALCRQLLVYAGQERGALRWIDPAAFLEANAELLDLTRALGVTIGRRWDQDLPRLHADEVQLRQLLMNLVANAAQASSATKGGEVRLEVVRRSSPERLPIFHDFTRQDEQPDAFVCFVVEDDGPGMDADTARHIFEPFFSRREGGHGMGLATVLGIVRNHRGALGVRTAPGAGTRIEATFPASSPAVPGGPSSTES